MEEMDYLSHTAEVSSQVSPPSCPAATQFRGSHMASPTMLHRYHSGAHYDPVHSPHFPSWGPPNPTPYQWPGLPPISAPGAPHIHGQSLPPPRMPAPLTSEPYQHQVQFAPSSLPPPNLVTFSGHHQQQQQQHQHQQQQHQHQQQQHQQQQHHQGPAGVSSHSQLPEGHFGSHSANLSLPIPEGSQGAPAAGANRHSQPNGHRPFHPTHHHRLSGPPAPPHPQQSHHHSSPTPYPYSHERGFSSSHSQAGNTNGGFPPVSSSSLIHQQISSMSSPGPGSGSGLGGPASGPGSSTGPGGSSAQGRPQFSSNQEHQQQQHQHQHPSHQHGGPYQQSQNSNQNSSQAYPVPPPAPLSAHPPNNNSRSPIPPYGAEYGVPMYNYMEYAPPPAQSGPPGGLPPPSENRNAARRMGAPRAPRRNSNRIPVPDLESDDEYPPPPDVIEHIFSTGMRGDDSHLRAAQLLRGSVNSKMVASASAIQSLESVTIDSLPEGERSCIICYNDFGTDTPEGVNEAPLRLPSCKHVFGDHCIKKWFEDSDSCPYCRSKVPSEPRLHVNGRAFAEYMRARGVRGLPAGLSPGNMPQEAVLRLMSRGGFVDDQEYNSGSRRSPPTEGAEPRRRIRARYSGPSSHRDSPSSSNSNGNNSTNTRPVSFGGVVSSSSQASPPRERFSSGGSPFGGADRDSGPHGSRMPRLDRMNGSPPRSRGFPSIQHQGESSAFSNHMAHQLPSSIQLGGFPRQQLPPLAGRPNIADSARQPLNVYATNTISESQAQRGVDQIASAQGGNEDTPMLDHMPVSVSDGRQGHRSNL